MSEFDRGDLYIDNYYEYTIYPNRKYRNNSEQLDDLSHSWTSLSRFILTFLLRIGFILIQIGSVPVTNINLILLQNVIDFSCVTVVYIIAGFVISYTGDLKGLMGEGHWIEQEETNKEETLIGWQAVVTASAICTSCLVGRTNTVGYLLIAIIMAGIVQPFIIHWAWTPKGWMHENNLHNQSVAFRDYGGSAVVHIVGSLTGTIGCIILGRRIIRLRDIDDASVPADSAGTAFAGYLLILLGLQSLCLPSASTDEQRSTNPHMTNVIVNNLLGTSSCSLVVVSLHFILSREPFNHWTVMRCVQASIAGMIIISSDVDVYSPIMCVGLGCSGGIIFYLVSRKVFQSALEDYCNIVATHLTCALVGSFVAPFCRNLNTGFDNVNSLLLNVAWQVICLVTIVTLVAFTMTVAFLFLECLGLLRNRSEFVNHLRAVVALERGPPRSYMQRLFLPDGESLYLQPGTVPVQRPGTIIGPRFIRYESAIERLENPKTEETVPKGTQRPTETEVVVAALNSTNKIETRVKKLRHAHTIKSASDTEFPEVQNQQEAMGDTRISEDDEEKISKHVEIDLKNSGDLMFHREPVDTDEDSLAGKFAALNAGKIKNCESNKKVKSKIRWEPYQLHRTHKCTNLRLQVTDEMDPYVKFLFQPRSFFSTDSDSEGDVDKFTDKEYPMNFETSVPIALVQTTNECIDVHP